MYKFPVKLFSNLPKRSFPFTESESETNEQLLRRFIFQDTATPISLNVAIQSEEKTLSATQSWPIK